MNDLHCNVRREVLNSTYPALYVVFFSILEGNTREATWREQHFKTLQITKENHTRLAAKIEAMGHVRSISIKDQERFTSPWAVTRTDETKVGGCDGRTMESVYLQGVSKSGISLKS